MPWCVCGVEAQAYTQTQVQAQVQAQAESQAAGDAADSVAVRGFGMAKILGTGVNGFDEAAVEEVLVDSAVVRAMTVSVVSCEPFGEVYSLYGHTGLRLSCPVYGVDLLANWGIFNMRQRLFALHFALGLTDYSMDIERWDYFCARYDYYGCGIYEQELSLTFAEKWRLVTAVVDNYREENRVYRYNYFFDNCTTRVRDIVEGSITGDVTYLDRERRESFRELIHEWNDTHRWARWGNDYLLGYQADRYATSREAQFLPFNLSDALAEAMVRDEAGSRPLVRDSHWVLSPRYDKGELSVLDEYVLSPTGIAMMYILIFVIILCIERRYHRRLWAIDIVMLIVTGAMGLLLFFMLFSQHPTVQLNGQLLVFNPLSLALAYPIYKSFRRGERSICLVIIALLLGVGIVIGMSLQHYAEGVMPLALFLLITYTRHLGVAKNEKKK